MPLYQARFLTHGSDVFGFEQFEAEHDEAAKDHARRKLRAPFGRGYEIWHGERLVHREIYE